MKKKRRRDKDEDRKRRFDGGDAHWTEKATDFGGESTQKMFTFLCVLGMGICHSEQFPF
jgi:hypothetical protein